MSATYDAIVIGSGTAGQTAAYDLRAKGLRVAVVEHSDRPGGTCALRGCQAKKWFYEGCEVVARSRHLSGIGIQRPAVANWKDLRDAKNRFTQAIPRNTIDGFEKAGIDFIPERARFLDHRSVAAGSRQLSARFFVVATGAKPRPLSIGGSHHLVISSEFMEREHLPDRIVFVGGGFISFEFAHFAVRLGPPNTRCTILEAGSHPLGPFDRQMVELLKNASAKEGIDVHCNVTITAVEEIDHGYSVKTQEGRRFEGDLVVHGAGRVADIDDLELDKADVAVSEKGITTNANMATSNPRVYAVGDCVDSIQLARVADAEAHVAAANIVSAVAEDGDKQTMDYSAVPTVLFTYPQYGMVGRTEDALKHSGEVYQKHVAKELSWPTYKRVGMTAAAYKLLVGERGELLGAHILSDNATGLINSFTLAMVNGMTVDDLYQHSIMSPYPSRESDMIYMLDPFLS